MNLKDNGTVCAIVKKLNEIRRGNRMMVNNDVNTTMTFFRKDEPEKSVGVVKINGACDFSLLDAGIVLLAVAMLYKLLSAFCCLFKRF